MKNSKSTQLQDDAMRQVIGSLLRWGVILSAVVTSIGGLFFLMSHGQEQVPSYQRYSGTLLQYRNVHQLVNGVINGNSESLIQIGIMMLIATPVARLVFSLFTFTKEKDFVFAGITLLVLCIVAFSMMGGFAV
jgi:uncharacterized membrane protein